MYTRVHTHVYRAYRLNTHTYVQR